MTIDMTSFFSSEGQPICIKFRRLVQNDMSTVPLYKSSVCGKKSPLMSKDTKKLLKNAIEHGQPMPEINVTDFMQLTSLQEML